MSDDRNTCACLRPGGDPLGNCAQCDPPSNARIVGCEACGTEGRIIINYGVGYDRHTGYYPDERDEGPCPWCEGTGGEIIETEPVTLEDLGALLPCA